MKRNDKKQTQIDDNLIDEVIRAAYGFSDEQLQAELDEAKLHPDTFPELKIPEDEFETILRKMQERGIKPHMSEGGRNTDTAVPIAAHMDNGDIGTSLPHRTADSRRKKITFHRMRKVLLVAAVLAVAGVGFSMNAVGKSATKYHVVNGEKNNIKWNNVKEIDDFKDITEAYAKIEKVLDIPALKLGYMPSDMEFDSLIVSEKYGIIRFTYYEQYLRVYQLGVGVEEHGLEGEDNQQRIADKYNPWLNKDIEVYEEISENGDKRYNANIKMNTASYYISGVLDKNEFLKIIEGLYLNNTKK